MTIRLVVQAEWHYELVIHWMMDDGLVYYMRMYLHYTLWWMNGFIGDWMRRRSLLASTFTKSVPKWWRWGLDRLRASWKTFLSFVTTLLKRFRTAGRGCSQPSRRRGQSSFSLRGLGRTERLALVLYWLIWHKSEMYLCQQSAATANWQMAAACGRPTNLPGRALHHVCCALDVSWPLEGQKVPLVGGQWRSQVCQTKGFTPVLRCGHWWRNSMLSKLNLCLLLGGENSV